MTKAGPTCGSPVADAVIGARVHKSPRLQSASASRFNAGTFGFLLLSQSCETGALGEAFFDTIPSRPILQAWPNTVGPSASISPLIAQAGRACLERSCVAGRRRRARSVRQRLSSASNRLSSGSVRGCCAWQRSYLQAASASGPAIRSSEVSYVYFERVAAAAPATALARSSCPFGA
jgi:hypothetical protein